MRKKTHPRLTFGACLLALALAVLSACGGGGESEHLPVYREQMDAFFDQIVYYDGAINAIDAEADSAADELLDLLNELAAVIHEMTAYEVPDVFPAIEELAAQSDQYMTEALRLYRLAFADGDYDENIADAALENYQRANLRLRYIGDILRGDLPEDIFTIE